MATSPQAIQRPGTSAGPSFAWFGGADLRALANAPSERAFYDALGVMVVLISCASGFAACLAISYVLQVPAARMWPVGVVWALAMACGVERLVLQLTATKVHWLLIGLVPRVALSLLVAVGMEPLILRINEREINESLNQNVTRAVEVANSTAEDRYVPLVEADYNQIASIRTRRTGLADKREHFRFLSSCEASNPSCSTTGRAGCAAYCAHYAREASDIDSQLAATAPQDQARIAYLYRDIKKQQEAMRDQEASRQAAIRSSNGLSARLEALGAIEKRHPSVKGEVWFFRLLFIILDLLPLSMKVLRMLSLESVPYEEACKAGRRRDMTRIKRKNAEASVVDKRITEQTRAEIDIDRVNIRLKKEQRIQEAYEASSMGRPTTGDFGGDAAIDAWDLDTFVDEMEPHEARPVSVPPNLRRGGLLGLVIFLATAGLMGTLAPLVGHALAGTQLVLMCLGLDVILMAYTRGFRRAPAWALRAIFASLLLALVFPIVIIGMNL